MSRFTAHAREKMRKRRISEQEVDEAKENPEISYVSEEGNDRTVILGTTKGNPARRLNIVVLTDDPDFVITVADRDDRQ